MESHTSVWGPGEAQRKTMYRPAVLSMEDMGQMAYYAFRVTTLVMPENIYGTRRELPEWGDLSYATKEAWMIAAGSLIHRGKDLIEGRHPFVIAESFYNKLADAGGLMGDYLDDDRVPLLWSELDLGDKVGFEIAIRHLVNCVQTDEGEDLCELAHQLIDIMPSITLRRAKVGA